MNIVFNTDALKNSFKESNIFRSNWQSENSNLQRKTLVAVFTLFAKKFGDRVHSKV